MRVVDGDFLFQMGPKEQGGRSPPSARRCGLDFTPDILTATDGSNNSRRSSITSGIVPIQAFNVLQIAQQGFPYQGDSAPLVQVAQCSRCCDLAAAPDSRMPVILTGTFQSFLANVPCRCVVSHSSNRTLTSVNIRTDRLLFLNSAARLVRVATLVAS